MNMVAKALILLFIILCSQVQIVSALDGGDVLAIIVGFSISIVLLCAGLGWYARRREAY